MNPIPARLMRGQAEACPTRPKHTERDRNRHAYIIDAATRIFTAHGRFRTTLREFAVAIGLTQIVIRNQIADMDHLFALVLANHLTKILAAVTAIQGEDPDAYTRRRAEYLRQTRGFLNVPTPIHFLWLRERFSLPEDELDPLEHIARLIGAALTDGDWQTTLTLLDTPHLDQPQIETMLAAHAQPRERTPLPHATQSPEAHTANTQPTAFPRPTLDQPAKPPAANIAAIANAPRQTDGEKPGRNTNHVVPPLRAVAQGSAANPRATSLAPRKRTEPPIKVWATSG